MFHLLLLHQKEVEDWAERYFPIQSSGLWGHRPASLSPSALFSSLKQSIKVLCTLHKYSQFLLTLNKQIKYTDEQNKICFYVLMSVRWAWNTIKTNPSRTWTSENISVIGCCFSIYKQTSPSNFRWIPRRAFTLA